MFQSHNSAYHRADPNVQCSSSTYQFGYLWAVVGAIIYAFAVPVSTLYMFFLNVFIVK